MHTQGAGAALPPALTVAAATVHFPGTLGPVLNGMSGGGTVDVFVMEGAPAVSGLTVVPVTVTFVDAGTAGPIEVQGLQDPVTIAWTIPNASALRQPLADWYQCVYEVCQEQATA